MTLILLGAGVYSSMIGGTDDYLGAASLRMSVVTAIVWLAWPQLIALPRRALPARFGDELLYRLDQA